MNKMLCISAASAILLAASAANAAPVDRGLRGDPGCRSCPGSRGYGADSSKPPFVEAFYPWDGWQLIIDGGDGDGSAVNKISKPEAGTNANDISQSRNFEPNCGGPCK